MRLNDECVRDLLLIIERETNYDQYIQVPFEFDDYSSEDIAYTADKLCEAGFINSDKPKHLIKQLTEINIYSLSWEGHKFLDNIRDDSVWKSTKGILAKFSSVSLGVISNVASQVIANMINSQMNLQ